MTHVVFSFHHVMLRAAQCCHRELPVCLDSLFIRQSVTFDVS